MSRELEFSGYWEGDAVYSCDNCGAQQSFPFDSEDVGSKEHRKELREKLGWITTKVDGEWYDFCCEFYKQYGLSTKVIPVTTAEYGLSKAARPFNSRLDKSKLVENGFQTLPTWQDAVSRYLKEAQL